MVISSHYEIWWVIIIIVIDTNFRWRNLMTRQFASTVTSLHHTADHILWFQQDLDLFPWVLYITLSSFQNNNHYIIFQQHWSLQQLYRPFVLNAIKHTSLNCSACSISAHSGFSATLSRSFPYQTPVSPVNHRHYTHYPGCNSFSISIEYR